MKYHAPIRSAVGRQIKRCDDGAAMENREARLVAWSEDEKLKRPCLENDCILALLAPLISQAQPSRHTSKALTCAC